MKVLKQLEPDLFKEIRKKVVSDLKPILNPIQGEINSQVTQEMRSTMRSSKRPGQESGFFHNGRSAWSGARLSPRVTTKANELIFINATGQKGQVGFDYAELAGIRRRPARRQSRSYTRNGETRRHTVNGQGDAMIAKLSTEFGKPGRFAWIRVLKRKPEIEGKVQNIADDYGIKLSRRLA